jgi:competence protein ComEC
VIRIGYTKNYRLFVGFLLCGLLVSAVCLHARSEYAQGREYVKNHENFNGVIEVVPDTIKVEGDLVQFSAKVDDYHCQCFYFMKSEKEQKYWQNIDNELKLTLSGELAVGTSRRNLNGFDYRNYLKQNNRIGTLSISQIKSYQKLPMKIFRPIPMLHLLRRKAIVHVETQFAFPVKNYISGLIFGHLAKDFDAIGEVYQRLGIIHLFSLSGAQVLFFLGLFRYLFLRVGMTKEKVVWFEFVFSFFYAGMTGFSISILRAIFQWDSKRLCERFELPFQSQDIFAFTVIFGIMFQPYLFLTLSGQLSYILGFLIVFLYPIFQNFQRKWLGNILFSVAISLGILPIIWWNFYEWSPISIFLTCLLSFFFDSFLLPVLLFCFFLSFFINGRSIFGLNELIDLFEKILKLVDESDKVNWLVGKPHWLGLIFLVFGVFYAIHLLETKNIKKLFIPVVTTILVILSSVIHLNGLVAMVDIGQGDCFFIQEPFSQNATLIDTGGKIGFEKQPWQKRAEKANAENTLIPFLKSRGVRKIKQVFITHSDADHCGDLATLAEKIPIEQVYFVAGGEKKAIFYQQLKSLSNKGVRLHRVLARNKIAGFSLLYPDKAGKGENNDSMILYRKIGLQKFLFTGDLEKSGEKRLLELYPNLKVDVLKVGHHGSKTASSDQFIRQLGAKKALISCGVKNRFHHPHQETLDTLQKNHVKIYRTDKSGMLYYEWYFWSNALSPLKQVKSD